VRTLVPSVVIEMSLSITRFVFLVFISFELCQYYTLKLFSLIYSIFPLQNVNLLQQFICPQTGMLYDPTRTGNKFLNRYNCHISNMVLT